MRSFISIALPALASVALAAPQDIDFALVDSIPDVSYSTAPASATAQIITYDASAILSSAIPQITNTEAPTTTILAKRAACATQPAGVSGYSYSPDAASAFTAATSFAAAASAAPTPSGYNVAFTNRNGSNNAYGYMGYTNLPKYDTELCASKCNAIFGCQAINIYFERDPSVEPAAGSCPDPPSVTYIKCVFWGGPVTEDNANNYGQFRSKFQVVIAGSNGYQNKSIAIPAGYSAPSYYGNAAINAPFDTLGADSYMGNAIFNSGPYNVQLCADACTMKSDYARAHPPSDGGVVQTCQFFNTYILYVNDSTHLQGQYCAMYSESWPKKYATNTGQYRGSDRYLIANSYAFSNSTNPGPQPDKSLAIYQAKKEIDWSKLQPYCSSILSYTTPVTTSVTTVTTQATSTVTVTVTTASTLPEVRKRQDSGVLLSRGADSLVKPTALARRSALPTPAQLTRYASDVISTACSAKATPVTSTSTTVVTSIATLSATVTTTTTTTTIDAMPTSSGE
ncbi:hypothetical protein CAC42_537 [Sphaceloma murrayae]|uniref:Carbohydrate-binding-like protein n=1 Tax=Sphaceloma murrayae TaxID=2082308 RepID=A0A2K1R3T0_9PEZI|nr:hypothetical protein CAC42_537 [Sphaceloma murrayae]